MTLEELNAIVDGVSKPFNEKLAALRSEISELKRSTVSVDRLQVFEMKMAELQRMAEANRRHVGNLESKITKLRGKE